MATQRDRTPRGQDGQDSRRGRHGRRGAGWGLRAGVPLGALVAAGLACGGAFGAFAAGGPGGAGAAGSTGGAGRTAAAAAPAWAEQAADGFASVEALGQDGTYGGRGGRTVTVRSLADLEKYATAAEPYVIVVDGAITMDPKGKEIKVASDKTIVGAGTSGEIVGGGFFLGQGVHNVILRNLTIRDSYAGTWNDKDHDWDAVQMDGAHHVWLDHNDLRHMADGLIDSRKDTTYLTVSWNRLENHNKAFGIGWTDHVTADITVHHNWFRETEQRNPSTDNVAHAHLYNNYLQDEPGTDITSSYGNYARGRTSMLLENSYFEGINNPVVKDDTASLVQRGNVFKGTKGRNESGGTAFDPKTYYPYTLDPAADVPALVTAGSGPRATPVRTKATTLTVAADGSAQYRTVQAAVDAVPSGNASRVVIAVAPGTYREAVTVPADKPHVTIQGTGQGPSDVRIVEGRSAGTPKPGGGTYGTSGSATLAVTGDDFQARDLTVANDFDEAAHQGQEGHQAVALRTAADKVVLRNIVADGDQDTLLLDTAAKDRRGRVYVDRSRIAGNVDFVFGRATAVFTDSVFTLKKRWDGTAAGYVTAPSTAGGNKGFLLTDSTVEGAVADRTFHLGRPWHAGGDATLDPQTVIRNTRLSAAVKTAPWTDMGGFSWKDDRFAEYANTGPGAGPASADRPQLTDQQATGYEIADWLGDWTPSGA
ncbi:pectinesterase family protein [Streptomyces olivaceiscleroticus]|uniref:Pectate lyase domain-containing protein n=1 Tax=Streptomyces olivaceiscleroticus TaxID=68245 RepID=A0ABP3J8D8_9ACTN